MLLCVAPTGTAFLCVMCYLIFAEYVLPFLYGG
jgi:hypothetical protein